MRIVINLFLLVVSLIHLSTAASLLDKIKDDPELSQVRIESFLFCLFFLLLCFRTISKCAINVDNNSDIEKKNSYWLLIVHNECRCRYINGTNVRLKYVSTTKKKNVLSICATILI